MSMAYGFLFSCWSKGSFGFILYWRKTIGWKLGYLVICLLCLVSNWEFMLVLRHEYNILFNFDVRLFSWLLTAQDILLNRSIKEALVAEEKFFRSRPVLPLSLSLTIDFWLNSYSLDDLIYSVQVYSDLADRCGVPQLAKKLNQVWPIDWSVIRFVDTWYHSVILVLYI